MVFFGIRKHRGPYNKSFLTTEACEQVVFREYFRGPFRKPLQRPSSRCGVEACRLPIRRRCSDGLIWRKPGSRCFPLTTAVEPLWC